MSVDRSQRWRACRRAWTACSLVLIGGIPLQGQAPRGPDEIAFNRLKADAVVAVALGTGTVATDDAVVVPTDAGLVRILASTNTIGSAALVGQRPCASLAAAFGQIWAPLCAHGRIARVGLTDGGVGRPVELSVADPGGRIATGVGSLWAASSARGVISRVDPDSGEVVAEIRVAPEPSSIVFGDDALWATSAAGDVLTHINAHTNEVVETVKVGPRPGRLAISEGAVWTLNRGDGSVSRVDPKTHKVVATIAIGAAAAGGEIAAGAGSVWVSATGLPLIRIDPRSNRAVQRFSGTGGGAVLVAHGSVWVAADAGATWRLDPLLVSAMRP